MIPNTTQARERILARLRQSAPSEAPPPLPDVAQWYAAHRPFASVADKARCFRDMIERAQASVHTVCATRWPDTLAQQLQARGIDQLLLAHDTPHGQAAMAALRPRGIACRPYDKAIDTWKAELFSATPASLTGAYAAIAETGSLILWPDEKEPRLMSLVPPLHIVLLDANKIYNTFYEAMSAEGWHKGLPTNALLISGPSKTADIQQTLAYGAHGPKELIVLLINAEEGAA